MKNVTLCLFKLGANVAPWLGNLQQLGPKEDLVQKKTAQGDTATIPSFPVKCANKKSYIATPVQTTVWLSAEGLNSDIQKLLRHARKLPEKAAQFYKVFKSTHIQCAIEFDELIWSYKTEYLGTESNETMGTCFGI